MDKNITQRFVDQNKRFVDDKERISKFPPKAVLMYKQFAQGKCFCGKNLIVNSFVKTGSGADWIFECGHKLTIISLEEAKNKKIPHGDKLYESQLELGKQNKVNVRTGGKKQGKEETELAVVKLLCHMYKKDLQNFSQPEVDSHIDVIGEDGLGNKVYFQVTQLYDQKFWHDLGKHEKASVELKDKVTVLIESAIKRKLNYPKELREGLILVIDSGAGIGEADIDIDIFSNLITESNFSEIWLVGRTENLTVKLFPYK
ncbi:MAG: hypothetical protein V4686_01840 [Patescibacteria group bacterium]